MARFRLICFYLAFLGLGFTSLPARTWASVEQSCCCATSCCDEGGSKAAQVDAVSQVKACCCDEPSPMAEKKSEPCSMRCSDQGVVANLAPAPQLPAPEWIALAATMVFCRQLASPQPVPLKRITMPAGWVLPTSPPICLALICLPPPVSQPVLSSISRA